MKARLINGVSKKYSTTYNFNDGLNFFAEPLKIKDNQLANCINISNRENNSSITVRQRKILYDDTAYYPLRGVGKRGKEIHVVYGTNYKILGGITSTVVITDGITPGYFCEFSTGTNHYIIYNNGTDRIMYNGTTFVTLMNAPTNHIGMDVVACSGRLFWIKDNKIIFSALQEPDVYDASLGGGEIILSESSSITAVAVYDNKVTLWDEYNMWVLYGTDPETFTLQQVRGGCGNTATRTTYVHNDSLYWGNINGFYKYDGGAIVEVGKEVKKYLCQRAQIECIGAYADCMYISIVAQFDYDVERFTMIWDMSQNKWYKMDGYYLKFVSTDQNLYGFLDSDKKIYNIDSHARNNPMGETGYDLMGIGGTTPTAITWNFETKKMDNGSTSSPKVLSEIWVRYSLGKTGNAATMILQYSIDGAAYQTIHTFSTTTSGAFSTVRILVPITSTGKDIQFKFSGTGYFVIDYVELKYRIKPR